MNRRITVAILVSVAAALLLAGVGTLVLTRLGARQAAEDDLRRQAEAVADLIALGQQKAGLGPADQAAIRQVVCNDSEPTNLSTTAKEAFGRLRVVVCAPGNGATGIETARQQLCGAAVPRLDAFLPTEVKKARDTFCKAPTEANLSDLRQSYCRADAPDRLDGAAQRRYEQLRRSLCLASRRTPGTTEDTQSLQSTLSKQSIELVGLTADGALAPDSALPPGLTAADLQPATLRQGLTVSGIYDGNRVYAAAAVNPDAQELSVVVVEGSADNVARRAVPWVLMASGITLLLGAAVAWGLSPSARRPPSPPASPTATSPRACPSTSPPAAHPATRSTRWPTRSTPWPTRSSAAAASSSSSCCRCRTTCARRSPRSGATPRPSPTAPRPTRRRRPA